MAARAVDQPTNQFWLLALLSLALPAWHPPGHPRFSMSEVSWSTPAGPMAQGISHEELGVLLG
jgi:hypothetical protein